MGCYNKGGNKLPVISQFYGILIYMYQELGAHHNEPHIHIKYNEYDMSMTLDGKILSGQLPKKQKKLVDAWMALHEDELKATWFAYNECGELIKIKGLE